MTVYGFWLYLMTDCILFASIFAVYAVLVNNVAGGPSGHDIFELPYVLGETALLLFSSITYGFAMLALFKGKKSQVLGWLAIFGLAGTVIYFVIHAARDDQGYMVPVDVIERIEAEQHKRLVAAGKVPANATRVETSLEQA